MRKIDREFIQVRCWQHHVGPPNNQSQIHKYKNTNTQIHKHANTNTQIHKYTNTQTHKYANIQIHKDTNTFKTGSEFRCSPYWLGRNRRNLNQAPCVLSLSVQCKVYLQCTLQCIGHTTASYRKGERHEMRK